MFEKKVLVAGTGKSGISAAALLVRNGAEVLLFDENIELDADSIMDCFGDIENKDSIEIILGEINDEIINGCSLMVISPGIPTDAPFVLKIKAAGVPIWSEIELAYHYEKGMIAAITGTNGKTTTTTLIGEILKEFNNKTFIVGNIGIPYTSLADKTSKDSLTVAEISSFQLETITDFKPHVSAILNITPDHLDRHYSFENYADCKMSISKNQTKDDYIILNYDDPEVTKLADKVKAKTVYFSRKERLASGVYVDREDVLLREDDVITRVLSLTDIKILGSHNVENILAAVAVTYYMGVPLDIIKKCCTNFRGVEHRIEYVRTINDVKYYNDSKGTNPEAAIRGIKSMTTTTFLIGGGYDKNSTYDEWIEAFDAKVKYLILLGQTAEKIALCAKRHGYNSIVFMDTLEEAVEFCYKNAKPGDAVLLSPACASWGMFENYEQRGNLFKEYVIKLEE